MKYDILLYNGKTLKSNKITIRFLLVLLLLATFFTVMFLRVDRIEKTITVNHETLHSLEIVEQDTFTVEKLMDYISFLNLKHGDIVLAQAMEETGHFTSAIFRENNNLFGMKLAMQRPHTYTGKNRGHASYDHWRQSVLDYAFYQAAYLRHLKTKEQYFTYLDGSYAEKKGYSNRLKKLIMKNEDLWNGWTK